MELIKNIQGDIKFLQELQDRQQDREYEYVESMLAVWEFELEEKLEKVTDSNWLNSEDLIKLGFKECPIVQDEELKYQCYDYNYADNYITITNSNECDGEEFIKQTMTINDRDFATVPNILEMEVLIKILFK